jgi:polysaccharide export outer membrane protein
MLRASGVRWWAGLVALAAAVGTTGPGCVHTGYHHAGPVITVPPPGAVPNELDKRTLPPYVIEPPDMLLVEVAVRAQVPKLDKDGNEIKDKNGQVVTQEETRGLPVQAVSGQFQVRIDGTVGLGFWGSVPVSGLTLDQTAETIRHQIANTDVLKRLTIDPKNIIVVVDVLACNSKRYYVIFDQAAFGEQVIPFPITGSETVLDAVGFVNGLPDAASRRNVWVARRCPHPDQPWQILPVDWVGITQHGISATNYQLMPGDRVYVKAQKLVAIDRALFRIISPIERIFGITLLGASTVNQIKGNTGGGGGSGF